MRRLILLLLLVLVAPVWADPDVFITTRDGVPFAQLQPDGTVLRHGEPWGSINDKGRVVVAGEYLGDVHPDGKLFNRAGDEIGGIDSQGKLVFRGKVFMEIYPKGQISRVLDEKHTVPWGKYTPVKQGWSHLHWLAAVCLFFQPGLKFDE